MTDDERAKRLEKLMTKYPRINREKHLEDLCICKDYLEGDVESFELLFDEACKRTRKYICHATHEPIGEQDREDILAETMNIAIMKVQNFGGWSRYSTWMRGIARHKIFSCAREKALMLRNEKHCDDCSVIGASHNPIEQWESDQDVNEMLSCLSERERTVVVGKVIHGQTSKNLAKDMGLSASCVGQIYRRAIAKMRELLTLPTYKI